jgi:hypothetical protein
VVFVAGLVASVSPIEERVVWLQRMVRVHAVKVGRTADRRHAAVQVFTGAVGDRPTLFFEVIQRIGCMHERSVEDTRARGSGGEARSASPVVTLVQEPGCGGFGKGNVGELYAVMEKYDSRLPRGPGDDDAAGGVSCAAGAAAAPSA